MPRAHTLGGQTCLEDVSVAQKGKGEQEWGCGRAGAGWIGAESRTWEGLQGVREEVWGCVAGLGRRCPPCRIPSFPLRHLSPAPWSSNTKKQPQGLSPPLSLHGCGAAAALRSSASCPLPPGMAANGTDRYRHKELAQQPYVACTRR